MDVRTYNREMWDRQVEQGNPWTVPVSPEIIAEARLGRWGLHLTEKKMTPASWFPPSLHGLEILGLACGGGQQGPVFAAAGARVTILDNSPRQLARDQEVAARERLVITTVEGDMRDLSLFADNSFDLIFHPVSNVFVPDVRPMWREAFRVLRPGGALLAGLCNPATYLFDWRKAEKGIFEVTHPLPYNPLAFSEEELAYEFDPDDPLEFSHSLEDLIGGQIAAGFLLTDLFEDTRDDPLGAYLPAYIATRAVKPM